MNIVYADDDQLSLQLVRRAFEAHGHHVTTVDSSDVNEMLSSFRRLLGQGTIPQVVILDGHNIVRDAAGTALVDLHPETLSGWLRRNGLAEVAGFVLYSSDDQLVEQIQTSQTAGFRAAVAKAGSQGGLNALLEAVERIGKEQ